MTEISNLQLSLIAEADFDFQPVGDWAYDQYLSDKCPFNSYENQKLGTKNLLVPHNDSIELGTRISLVPNFQAAELGTKLFLVPNSDEWKPPIGCFQQKWIKDHQYWYWRYYDNRGKKASLYLAKDYNKAVRKAMKIGIPPNAKSSQDRLHQTDPQAATQTDPHLIDITSTAHPAPRAA